MVNSLQAVRFFAAFAIVVYHAARQLRLSSENELINRVYEILSTKLELGVDVFFVISGYVIYSSYQSRNKSAGEFIIDRIIRVAPMYWVTSIIFILMLHINFNLYPISDISFTGIIKSLLFIPSLNLEGKYLPVLSVGWSLNLEMMFYASFSLCILLFKRRIFISIISVVSLVYLLSPIIEGMYFYHNTLVFEFLAGCVIASLGDERLSILKRHKKYFTILLLVAFLLALTISSSNRLLIWGVPSFLLVLFCVTNDKSIRTRKAMMVLGASSYSLYLLHRIVITSVAWAYGNEDNAMVLFLISISLSVLLSVYMYKYIEMPVTNWLRGFSMTSLCVMKR
ncbi:acyltransferase [Cronobacter sakazakii]|nr:acyltransferase [Cronobacter sakazakii]